MKEEEIEKNDLNFWQKKLAAADDSNPTRLYTYGVLSL